jgi:hypothetical protein
MPRSPRATLNTSDDAIAQFNTRAEARQANEAPMKWLDKIFAKIWWSLHPKEAAHMNAMLIEARLEYHRRVTEFLIGLTDNPEEKKQLRRQLFELEAKRFRLPDVSKVSR